MKSAFVSLAGTLLCLALMIGCQKAVEKDKGKIHDVEGTVVLIDAERKHIALDHQEIPGFMEAMQMRFTVADPKLLEGLKPGDQVIGKLLVEKTGHRLVELKKQ